MREWKEAPTLPWFLGWTTGVNYDVFFWARKREAFSSLSSQWSAIFSYPCCLFPLLTLTGLAFSSFPTFLQVVANLTSNSSWLWSTSEVLCFLIWKTRPHKVHAFVPTFFFFCQKCVTCPFFSGKLCQSTEALFSYDFLSEVIPSSKCGLCGPPCSSTSLGSHLHCRTFYLLHRLSLLSSPSHHSITHTGLSLASCRQIIIPIIHISTITSKRRSLHILDTQVEFNYEIQMKSLHAFLYKLLPRFIFFKHFFSFLLMD